MTTDVATAPATAARPQCFHCGTLCRTDVVRQGDKAFCCRGCLTVYELLTENGLDDFYRLAATAGVRVNREAVADQFKFLDEPEVRARLVDFSDARVTRVTFHLPAIHCIACVWLLENLFRLKPGIGQTQVNFPRKEAAIVFDPSRVRLSEVVTLLTTLGYEPELKLAALEAKPRQQAARRLWVQLGVAGFAFGNIMLFSVSDYLGLDAYMGPGFRRMTGMISLVLALPVVTYSAQDYWRAAATSLRQRLLNIDVPIALGLAALFVQSLYAVVWQQSIGYFDSLCGLVFFLLCGKWFQQKTYDRLAFDRDYKSFFPLAVTRKTAGAGATKAGEERVALGQLAVGDRLIIRNGELIPADARLVQGPALLDYSFVTGESEPVEKQPGEHLYAGGRQVGGVIEVETVKAVSQSYLTSLWNQEAFRKDKTTPLDTLTNRYSRRFTWLVLAIAVLAATGWALVLPAIAVKAFTAVLIVACPCALALAAPFALGSAQRVLARHQVYLKNPGVLETLARVDAVVFDKTGTLTAAGAQAVTWQGPALAESEERWLYSMTRHSTHPLPVRIGAAIAREHFPDPVRSFLETPGCGMEGSVAGHEIWMGAAAWLEARQAVPDRSRYDRSPEAAAGSRVHVAIDGRYRGCFVLATALRLETGPLLKKLSARCELALLSGDNARERERFGILFGPAARLQFNQSPQDKLRYIRQLQATGRTVMMVGDGLNDAGALQQSDVGVAVVEQVSAFSPASDVIVAADLVPRLAEVQQFARQAVGVVRASFAISALYNLVGIGIAAGGGLSPVVCAILMPLSSVTVVAFACGLTAWLGRKTLAESRHGAEFK
ncbi:MAG TPA: heavy metal translocating P-type ATPase metal-binding domain-containing protein, partial [Dongiaceae bacterium]|nr:heavy metal translocating P-type ATPase metal-binding domain-containing protein [Dongiaceae bacterium]